MTPRARLQDDRGSIAVELAFLMPLLLLLLALLYGYGRVAQVERHHGGGRARRRPRRQPVAQRGRGARGRRAGGPQQPGPGATACQDTLSVTLRDGLFRAGFPVTVTARCRYPLGDLGLPGVPGRVDVSSTFTSPVDPNRGVR